MEGSILIKPVAKHFPYFEKSLEPHASIRDNTERFCVAFTQW
jgi:hypothetical protein